MPVSEVVWSQTARADLLAIYVSVGRHHEQAAERLFSRMEWRAAQLADQPRLGQRRRDIAPSTRVLVEAPYLILYETHPDTDDGPVATVEIVSVLDGRRDVIAVP